MASRKLTAATVAALTGLTGYRGLQDARVQNTSTVKQPPTFLASHIGEQVKKRDKDLYNQKIGADYSVANMIMSRGYSDKDLEGWLKRFNKTEHLKNLKTLTDAKTQLDSIYPGLGEPVIYQGVDEYLNAKHMVEEERDKSDAERAYSFLSKTEGGRVKGKSKRRTKTKRTRRGKMTMKKRRHTHKI
jgi:hypothetical protein